MNCIKRTLLTAAVVSLALGTSCKAFAGGTGYIDLGKVASSYGKAQDLGNEIKTKEAEIRKFATDAQKEVAAIKNPDDAKKLEDKYNKDLQSKVTLYRNSQVPKLNTIENNITNAIKKVAEKKRLDTVVRKESILFGGIDITDDVLTILNKK